MKLSLDGKTALVCGASDGIGAAIAKTFAEAGATVFALARREEKLKALDSDLPGPGHEYISADLSRPELIADLLKTIETTPDILILNSTGPAGGPLLDAEDEKLEQAFVQHVITPAKLVKWALPGMKEKGYGRIIQIISTSVKQPIPNLGASNTIRGAVANWSKTLAGEVGGFGVTVNNILPGYTETPRLASLLSAASEKLGKSQDEVAALWRQKVPMARFAKPEETAAAALFLASPMAGYITGTNLPVDGGRTGSL